MFGRTALVPAGALSPRPLGDMARLLARLRGRPYLGNGGRARSSQVPAPSVEIDGLAPMDPTGGAIGKRALLSVYLRLCFGLGRKHGLATQAPVSKLSHKTCCPTFRLHFSGQKHGRWGIREGPLFCVAWGRKCRGQVGNGREGWLNQPLRPTTLICQLFPAK